MKFTTDATPIFDSDAIEKKFRDSRILSLPENLKNRKGRRPDVSTIRTILQNWWNPQDIPDTQVKKSTKSNYRYMIRKYLKGEKTILSNKQIPLIEEYREYITTEPENLATNKPVATKRKQSKVQPEKTSKIKETVLFNESNSKLPIPMEFIKYIKELGVKEFTLRF